MTKEREDMKIPFLAVGKPGDIECYVVKKHEAWRIPIGMLLF